MVKNASTRNGQSILLLTLGLGVALGLASCADAGAPNTQHPGTGGDQGTGGASAQGSGGGDTGGANGGGASGAGTSSGGSGGGSAGSSGESGSGGSSATGGASGSGGNSGSSSDVDASGTSGSSGSGGGGGTKASTEGDASVKGADSGPPVTSGPGCTGFTFCDDFESYANGALPAGKWTTRARGGAAAVVDDTMAYSGKHSIHFTGTVSQGSANIIAQSAPTFPIQGDTIYMRMMMYIKSYPATGGTHTRIMRIGNNTNGADGTAYSMHTYNGTGIEHVNSGQFRNTSIHLMDMDVKSKWICWEMGLDNKAGPPKGDTGTVMAYLWRDGTAVTLTTTSDKLPWNPIPWQMLIVGLEAYQNDTQPGDFWIDDIAIDSKRVGCPAK